MTDHLFLLTSADKEEQQRTRGYWASRVLFSLHSSYSWSEIRTFTGKTRQTWLNITKNDRRICNALIKNSTNSMRAAGFNIPTEQIISDFHKGVPVTSSINFLPMSKRYQPTYTDETNTEKALELLMSDSITPTQFQGFIEVTKQIIKSKISCTK
jgi:hypothetical protein